MILCRYAGPSDSAYVTRAAITIPTASHYIAGMYVDVACLVLRAVGVAVAVSRLRLACMFCDLTILMNIAITIFLALARQETASP